MVKNVNNNNNNNQNQNRKKKNRQLTHLFETIEKKILIGDTKEEKKMRK